MLHKIQLAIVFGLVAALALVTKTAHASIELPTSGLVLALDASQNVTTTSGVVTGWADANTSVQRVNGTLGAPTLDTLVTPNGTHAAISFNGSSGLSLNDAPALSLQNLSVFVVGSLTVPNTSAEFISNYNNNGVSNGWAAGISDATTDSPKWFTGPDGIDHLGANTGATLIPGSAANNAYLLTFTISAGLKDASAANMLNLSNVQTSAARYGPWHSLRWQSANGGRISE